MTQLHRPWYIYVHRMSQERECSGLFYMLERSRPAHAGSPTASPTPGDQGYEKVWVNHAGSITNQTLDDYPKSDGRQAHICVNGTFNLSFHLKFACGRSLDWIQPYRQNHDKLNMSDHRLEGSKTFIQKVDVSVDHVVMA